MPVSPVCTCLSCPTHPRGGCGLYPSSMSDAQWAAIESVLPPPASQVGRGRPEVHARCLVLDAVFYLVAEGIRWRGAAEGVPAVADRLRVLHPLA